MECIILKIDAPRAAGWAIWPTRISPHDRPETHATIHLVVVFDVGG
jgi:hypothetical protein